MMLNLSILSSRAAGLSCSFIGSIDAMIVGSAAMSRGLTSQSGAGHARIRFQSVLENNERTPAAWECVSLNTISAPILTACLMMPSCKGRSHSAVVRTSKPSLRSGPARAGRAIHRLYESRGAALSWRHFRQHGDDARRQDRRDYGFNCNTPCG